MSRKVRSSAAHWLAAAITGSARSCAEQVRDLIAERDTALLLITALLQQTDSLHVMPVEVARYYASLHVLAILPIDLPCHMDAFGIITREGHLMSPGARQLLHEVRSAARDLY